MGRRIAIGISIMAWVVAEAGAVTALCPADIAWINTGGPRATVTVGRVLVRFDLTRIKNAEKISRATLRLMPRVGHPVSGPVEARPVTTDWGSLSRAFRQHEDAWLKANREGTLSDLVWEQKGRTGPRELHPGHGGFEERYQIGKVDWEWALFPVTRWRTPGGDLADGPVADGLQPLAYRAGPKPVPSHRAGDPLETLPAGTGPAGPVLDVTAAVRAWTAGRLANCGLMLKLADESGAAPFDLDGAWLELEGDDVTVDLALRIDHFPAWLPKTYRIEHPRFSHPDAAWLVRAEADPAVLGRLGKIEQLIIRQRLNPTPAGAQALSDFIGRDKPFNASYWADMYSLGVLYDWGCDLLSPEDRRCLLFRLKRLCGHTEPTGTTLNAPGNHGAAKVMWAALSIYPDMPGARRHVWYAKAHFIDTCIPLWHLALGDEGGFWHEQHIPYRSLVSGTMSETLWGWSGPTGEDLFAGNPWWESIIYAPIYGRRPDGLQMRHGLMYPGEPPGAVGPAVTATQVYHNPYGPGARDGITPTAKPWGPPLPEGFPHKTRESLPLTRYTRGGLGFVLMRSDWSEDGTFIWFKCGLTGRAHNLLDAGHFSIYKRAPLAVNSGSYLGGNITAYTVYSHLAVSKNTITVTDPNERQLRVEWMRNNVKDGLIPNDGGQRWTAGKLCSDTPWSVPQFQETRNHCTGQVIAFQPGGDFTYVCGDVTEAYTNARTGTDDPRARSKRVRKFLRTLLYLPPDHLVVFDQVESFNKDFKKRWLLHTVNEPKVDGNLIAAERTETVFRNRYSVNSWDHDLKHAIRATADHPFFQAHPDCAFKAAWQPQLYQYDGVMFVRTLLPANPEIVKVGGPGKEFWINGQNYADAYREVASHEGIRHLDAANRPYLVTGDVGRWRIEVSPGVPAENDRFLNVFQAGIASRKPQPTPVRLIDAGGDKTGVEVDLGDGRTATVVFKAGVGGRVRIAQAGRAVVDQDLAEEVLPNLPISK